MMTSADINKDGYGCNFILWLGRHNANWRVNDENRERLYRVFLGILLSGKNKQLHEPIPKHLFKESE